MSEDPSQVLDDVKHLLPAQGPLEFFVHHNTFHAFEHLEFKTALEKGQILYGAKVYLSIREYKEKYDQGDILDEYLNQKIEDHFSNLNLDQVLIRRLVNELLFLPSSSELTFSEIPDALELGTPRRKKVFYAELLKEERDLDIDDSIRHSLLSFLGAYYDQGYAYWSMPDREKGLLFCFTANHKQGSLSASQWQTNLQTLIEDHKGKTPLETIDSLLKLLKIPDRDRGDYLFSLSYRYKGWASLSNSLVENPAWNRNPEWVKASFEEFLCILLYSELAFLQTLDFEVLSQRIASFPHFRFFSEYSSEFKVRVAELSKAQGMDLDTLKAVTRQLRDIDRQYILQCAYEDSFYDKFLKAFLDRQAQRPLLKSKDRPSFQAFCCIDDREESFRRYMEEIDPRCETLGVAGHFGLDINYKGVFNAYYRPLCPNIIKPTKTLNEEITANQSVRSLITTWVELSWLQATGSKILLRGWIFQFFMSFLAFLPLALSIAMPSWSAHLKKIVRKNVSSRIKTRLLYLEGEVENGMSFEDEIRYSEGLLRSMGLTQVFSSVVFAIGHGSHSLNNPHESAYNCGACGGGRGAPNGRLIATLLNKESVRKVLVERGIDIPEDTLFVGAYHNTASDEVLFFDLPQRADVQSAINTITTAGQYNAKERCRRFVDTSLEVSPKKAFHLVNGRAHDYAQARPEYNHANNCLCIVGPREYTKNIFLDHRAFLVSYEPEQDPLGVTLKNIMSAVGPVCSGINLEYYFSRVDCDILGCGSKIPHNVTGLLGVMAGYESDLLLGLSSQMVEIHDPLRLMLTLVSPLKLVERLFEELESFNRLVTNQWIRLSVYDPETNKMFIYSPSEGFKQADIKSLSSPVYDSNFGAFEGSREICEFGNIEVEHA